MTSLADVAALAGVSPATVSRVLNDSSHPVAEATRQSVLEAAAALDFQPNMLASGLVRNRTKTVAILVHDLMDAYFSEIARGIEDQAYARGYVTFMCNTDRDPAKELHYFRKLRALKVDAIVLTAGGLTDPDHAAQVDQQLARISSDGGTIVRLAPAVGYDPDIGYSNRRGFALAVDHLFELGHRDVGFVAGPSRITTSSRRRAAMNHALEHHGLTLPDEMVFEGGFSRAGGEHAADAFVDRRSAATAVVCANDQSAIGFVRRLIERGVAVPDDVSVVGFDDIAPCAYTEPLLTTVHVPLYELGASGMQLALDLLDGGERPEQRELPLTLAVRSTTAPPRRR